VWSDGDLVKTLLRVAVACALGILFSLAGQGVAAAHADLVSSLPTPGSTLEEPPEQIVLEFSAPVIARLSQVVVHDADGGLVDIERLSVVGEGQLVAVVDHSHPEGAWTVDYKVVSVDGHTTEGTVEFTVDSPVAVGSDVLTAPSSQWLITSIAALMVVALAVVVHLRNRRSSRDALPDHGFLLR